jgi:predicted Fe-S protein YdhL (DUF1289 family)
MTSYQKLFLQENTPISPCIDICKLNENNICEGCFRSIEEIKNWGSYSLTKKLDILEYVKRKRN